MAMNNKKKITLMGNQAQLGNLLWTHFSAKSKFEEVTDLNLAGYPPYLRSKSIPFNAWLPRKWWGILTKLSQHIIPGRTISENLFFLESMTAKREGLLADTKFNEAINDMAEKFIRPYQGEFLCAIHWRQGDYKYWKDGRYWVSPEELQCILTKLKEHFGDVHFIICTDGEHTAFTKIDYTYSSLTDPMADILLMSRCHCLVGSRSTFGAFAAWLGGIPHIELGSASNIEKITCRGFHTKSIVDNEIEFTERTT